MFVWRFPFSRVGKRKGKSALPLAARPAGRACRLRPAPARGQERARDMRVAIVENTRDHPSRPGRRGAARTAGADRLYRPWSGQPLPDMTVHTTRWWCSAANRPRPTTTPIPTCRALARLMAGLYGEGERPCWASAWARRSWPAALAAKTTWAWHANSAGARWPDRGRAADPVLGALPARFPIFQWHSDTFTLPPGAPSGAFRGGRGAMLSLGPGRIWHAVPFRGEPPDGRRLAGASWRQNPATRPRHAQACDGLARQPGRWRLRVARCACRRYSCRSARSA
jgi:hypothetical protein